MAFIPQKIMSDRIILLTLFWNYQFWNTQEIW